MSLISIFCCCAFGAVGAILAYQAKDLLVQQRYEAAQEKLKAAKVIALIGIGLGLVLPLLQLAASVLSFALSF